MSKRKPLSTRTRFEIFKRDDFTCRYCGGKSPDVVLELDHVVAVAAGGSNDPMNMVTSCHECNSGKSDKPLTSVMTGEDPHDMAIELLERRRQLCEYEAARNAFERKVAVNVEWIEGRFKLSDNMRQHIRTLLREFPAWDIDDALRIAIDKTNGREPNCSRYLWGIVRNWREQNQIKLFPVECHYCGKSMPYRAPLGSMVLCSENCLASMSTASRAEAAITSSSGEAVQ